MRELLAITKALADESRLRILAALGGRELCLCQLVELLGLATSTVSRHVSILEQARLVDARKQGRWSFFRLAGEGDSTAAEATALVLRRSAGTEQVQNDARRLQQILKIDPEELCRRHSECKC